MSFEEGVPQGAAGQDADVQALRRQRQDLMDLRRGMDARLFDYHSLLRASRALHYCRDTEQLLTLMRSMIQDRIQCRGLWCYISEPGTSIFSLVHTSALPAGQVDHVQLTPRAAEEPRTEHAFSLNPGILWQLLCQGEPFSVVDLDGSYHFPELFSTLGIERFPSVVWLPLARENQPMGFVALGPRPDGAPFSRRDMEFLHTIGEQASVALSSVFLYRQLTAEQAKLDRTIRNLSVLYDISRAMNQIDNMKQLLLEILDRAIQRVGAQKGSIMLYDSAVDLLQLQVVRGLPDREAEARINAGEQRTKTFRPGEGIAGKVFASRQPYLSNDTGADEQYLHAKGSYTSSIICLPMVVNDEPIGVINITNKQGDVFSDEDTEILTAIASQAAVIISKADLYKLATTDELTGLYVRRFFFRRLEEELRRCRRYKRPVGLMMLDLDHFKRVNDTYGHDAGDLVLREVSRLLLKNCRDCDVVSRHGGEEITVLMPETDEEGVVRAGERLRKLIEALDLEFDGRAIKVTVSIGTANPDEEAYTGEAIFRRADIAVYHAKERGRNRVVPWIQGMEHPRAAGADKPPKDPA